MGKYIVSVTKKQTDEIIVDAPSARDASDRVCAMLKIERPDRVVMPKKR